MAAQNSQKSKRDANLRHRYDITEEQYTRMLKRQKGRCAICQGRSNTKNAPLKLYVDHCHGVGRVRGLLCNKCNTLLGFARESVWVLKQAIKYIQERG